MRALPLLREPEPGEAARRICYRQTSSGVHETTGRIDRLLSRRWRGARQRFGRPQRGAKLLTELGVIRVRCTHTFEGTGRFVAATQVDETRRVRDSP